LLATSLPNSGNVAKNGWWICQGKSLECACQLEEELGSAGEQPASNTTDAYTVGRQPSPAACFVVSSAAYR
jgi:hypothetical protein